MSESEDDKEIGGDQDQDQTFVEDSSGGEEIEDVSFESPHFSLSHQLISNLTRQGLTTATAVQRQVIPKIRYERGKDLCVNAPTGSGKTLAYALPIIEVLARLVKVLIVT